MRTLAVVPLLVACASCPPPVAAPADVDGEPELDEAPIVGVVRTPIEVGGEPFIEVRTASTGLLVPVPPAPPSCTAETLVSLELASAATIDVATVGGRDVVAVTVWPSGGGEHLRTWDFAPDGTAREATLPREVNARAYVHGGEIVVAAWEQRGGLRLHRFAGADPTTIALELDLFLGTVEAEDGTLWAWHHHAMSEAGDADTTLSHLFADGTIESTGGEMHGAILGVVPVRDRVALLRTPILGERGDVVTLMTLGPSLAPERDSALRERLSALDCAFWTIDRGATEGRLSCRHGDTWRVSAYSVMPDLAFEGVVFDVSGSAVPVAIADDEGAFVVETFGGELARFPRTRSFPIGAAVAVDGDRVLVGWIESADRDAPSRRLEVRRLSCPSRVW